MGKYPVRKYEGLEIDKEALAKELRGKPMRGLDYHDDRPYLELADAIISTMPTWLKRSEDNGR